MKTLYNVQIRKADGTIIPSKNVLAQPSQTQPAMVVAILAALAHPDAGANATVESANTRGDVDIDAIPA